jgi:hypothetical protein
MKHVIRVVSHWGLLLHIYISMAGFSLVLLFAVTGLTLNHQDFGWGDPKMTSSTLDVPLELLAHPVKTAIENQIRGALSIRSHATDYHEDADQIQITFAVPGRRTIVTVNRADGKADVEAENRGIFGKIDDLHKGFDSGPVWYWLIDITAILLTISSLTGMVTLLALRARRRSGFIVGSLAIAMLIAIYLIYVPQ